MAVLGGLSSIKKEIENTVTLDKTGLFTLAPVLADAYFSTQANVKRVKFIYKSDELNQMIVLDFDLSQASPSLKANFSAKAKDNWSLQKIILKDHDGGKFIIQGANIPNDLAIQITGLITFTEAVTNSTLLGSEINAVATQSDNKILIGGAFTSHGAITGRSRLIRFNSDGTVDTAFCANAVDGNLINGTVYAIAVQSDGKILVGGEFTNIPGGPSRNRLVRFNSNGTVDSTFMYNAVEGMSPKFNNAIYSIALQSDGKILVGGAFTDYAGTLNRNRLVRLNSDGTLDTAFCTNASDSNKFGSVIQSISIQPNGGILVGGNFTAYAGTLNRNYLVRLNSDGTLDTAFCTNAVDGNKFSSIVISTATQSDNKILIGGQFQSYKTANRNYLIRLNSDGTLDTAFCANASDSNKHNNQVYAFAVQSDGKILVGGYVANYDGVSGRNGLLRLNSDGTLDTDFCVNAVDGTKFPNRPKSIAFLSDSSILIGGFFSSSSYNYFAALSSSGVSKPLGKTISGLAPKFTSTCYQNIIQPDGKILICGGFYNYGGVTRRDRLIRLNSDGTVDADFCANAVDSNISSGKFNNLVYSIALQSDGKILVGGDFTSYNFVSGRNRLVRLNSDGTLDTAFCANASDGSKFGGYISKIALQSDGKILVGGNFINYGGVNTRNRLIRLNSDGTVDADFCVQASDGNKIGAAVWSFGFLSNGYIIVGGQFQAYNTTAGRNYLIKLHPDGYIDTAFCANASDGGKFSATIYVVAVQSDGKILIGGDFTGYPGATGRSRLIRLNSDGTIDTAFCANAVDLTQVNGTVRTIILQSDNKILVGGDFTSYKGASGRNRLVRLNSDGTLDTDFCVAVVDNKFFDGGANGITLDSDGKILISGSLTYSTYKYFVAFKNNQIF